MNGTLQVVEPSYTANVFGTGYYVDTSRNSYTDIYWKNAPENMNWTRITASTAAASTGLTARADSWKQGRSLGMPVPTTLALCLSPHLCFTPNKAVDSAPVMYYWDAATYNSVSKLTAENATGVLTMVNDGNGNWGAAVAGIAAKEIDETIYVAGIYSSGGVTYPTSVISYSLGKYCQTIAANGEEFGAATAVYGYYAKAYFN